MACDANDAILVEDCDDAINLLRSRHPIEGPLAAFSDVICRVHVYETRNDVRHILAVTPTIYVKETRTDADVDQLIRAVVACEDPEGLLVDGDALFCSRAAPSRSEWKRLHGLILNQPSDRTDSSYDRRWSRSAWRFWSYLTWRVTYKPVTRRSEKAREGAARAAESRESLNKADFVRFANSVGHDNARYLSHLHHNDVSDYSQTSWVLRRLADDLGVHEALHGELQYRKLDGYARFMERLSLLEKATLKRYRAYSFLTQWMQRELHYWKRRDKVKLPKSKFVIPTRTFSADASSYAARNLQPYLAHLRAQAGNSKKPIFVVRESEMSSWLSERDAKELEERAAARAKEKKSSEPTS